MLTLEILKRRTRTFIYYHEMSEKLYTLINQWTNFLGIILTLSAIACIFSGWNWTGAGIISGTAFMNVIIYAFKFTEKPSFHNTLRKKWIEFLGECQIHA